MTKVWNPPFPGISEERLAAPQPGGEARSLITLSASPSEKIHIVNLNEIEIINDKFRFTNLKQLGHLACS